MSSARGGEAALWAQALRQGRRISEYTLGPATLEDAYLALASEGTRPETTLEETRERAA
jgi:hypothetical protein